MLIRNVDPDNLGRGEDWEGNNAAFTCPACSKVFIVSDLMHGGERDCPECRKSTGRVMGGKKSGGSASIELKD
jgi:Zn finger protein HypA/HybF involved in hydrogenase expression